MEHSSWMEEQTAQTRERLARIEEIHAELADAQAVGRSPDNQVTARITGHGRLAEVEIAAHALSRGDAEALGRAVVTAVNAAFAAAQTMNRERMAEVVDFSTYDAMLEQLRTPDPADGSPPPVIGY